jgi:hypothetical protein
MEDLMAKKAPVSLDLGNLNIKLADGKKSKADKPDRLTIESPTTEIPNPNFNTAKPVSKTNPENITIPLVDKCIDISHAIENLETELRMHEASLIESGVKAKTAAADDDDKFVKTIDVSGSSLKMQIQFRDAYSAMDVAMEDPLKKIFGEKYATLFTKITSTSIRDGKMESLKTLLGDQFDVYFNTTESLKPAENFQQTFFGMRKSFKPEQKEVIEKVKAATQSKPAIKYPK